MKIAIISEARDTLRDLEVCLEKEGHEIVRVSAFSFSTSVRELRMCDRIILNEGVDYRRLDPDGEIEDWLIGSEAAAPPHYIIVAENDHRLDQFDNHWGRTHIHRPCENFLDELLVLLCQDAKSDKDDFTLAAA